MPLRAVCTFQQAPADALPCDSAALGGGSADYFLLLVILWQQDNA